MQGRVHRPVPVLVQVLVLGIHQDSPLGLRQEHNPCHGKLRVADVEAVRLRKVVVLDSVVVADEEHIVGTVRDFRRLPDRILVKGVSEAEAVLKICRVSPPQKGGVLLGIRREDFKVDVSVRAHLADVVDIGLEGAGPDVLCGIEAKPLYTGLNQNVKVPLVPKQHPLRGLEVRPLASAPPLEAVLVVPVVTHHVHPRVKVVTIQAGKPRVEPVLQLLVEPCVLLRTLPLSPVGNHRHVVEYDVGDDANALFFAPPTQLGKLLL
mmetsp:Transcript_26071/g.65836  ORF Transcript_26071/g.65836 Transcript_26071/m.65836 type:complete len:264 (+) Transcript_26071:599-1390(+)